MLSFQLLLSVFLVIDPLLVERVQVLFNLRLNDVLLVPVVLLIQALLELRELGLVSSLPGLFLILGVLHTLELILHELSVCHLLSLLQLDFVIDVD